jgi:hypothetical protein
MYTIRTEKRGFDNRGEVVYFISYYLNNRLITTTETTDEEFVEAIEDANGEFDI